MKFQVRGHGERRHVCNCVHCTYDERQWVEINETVEARSAHAAEMVILKREGDVEGDFWWIEGPEIARRSPAAEEDEIVKGGS